MTQFYMKIINWKQICFSQKDNNGISNTFLVKLAKNIITGKFTQFEDFSFVPMNITHRYPTGRMSKNVFIL